VFLKYPFQVLHTEISFLVFMWRKNNLHKILLIKNIVTFNDYKTLFFDNNIYYY